MVLFWSPFVCLLSRISRKVMGGFSRKLGNRWTVGGRWKCGNGKCRTRKCGTTCDKNRRVKMREWKMEKEKKKVRVNWSGKLPRCPPTTSQSCTFELIMRSWTSTAISCWQSGRCSEIKRRSTNQKREDRKYRYCFWRIVRQDLPQSIRLQCVHQTSVSSKFIAWPT